MRITKISVRELFGLETFNYNIELKMDEKITIVHGPNGSGKTVLFKMIDGLFNNNHFIFWRYPFKEFKVSFDDDENILVTREYDKKEERYKIPVITYSKYVDKPLLPELDERALRRLPPSLRRKLVDEGSSHYFTALMGDYFRSSGTDVELERYLHMFGEELEYLVDRIPEQEWLGNLRRRLNVSLIDTDRLLVHRTSKDSSKASNHISGSAVTENSDDLSSRIQSKILEADASAKTLDRTFPSRVVDSVVAGKSQNSLLYSTIRKRLDELEKKRQRLIDAGLLEAGQQETEFQIPEAIQDDQQEQTLRRVLTMYVRDTERKLKIYQELADRIELFKEIIQGMLRHKTIRINKEGFRIEGDNGKTIPLEELSSGEKHMIVLMYNLLFRKEKQVDELVLIDEPEISLHITWQKRFIDNLARINKLSNFDAVIATHSTSIINGQLDLLVDITGSPSKEQ